MSELDCGDNEFNIDDDSFKDGAGINKITEAYAKVFKSIKELADGAEKAAAAGQTKEFMNAIRIFQNKSAQLSDLQALTKPIIGANGLVYNAFGDQIDVPDEGEDDGTGNPPETMDESELVKKIDDIVKNNINLSFADAQREIENQEKSDGANNITDDGTDHGDLDKGDW